ncbi:serine/threonine-protein kinase [Kitasatospora sp. NPDC059648]|uniref:serine/threonine-protein kinase n=1 Tax=Kitasatospora sp. NPDC059648 TaxID=3346894 RepID=UPI00368848D1
MEIGTMIAGRYRVDRFLGEGGMGAVWAADDTLLHRPVAVKLLHDDGSSARARFLAEARAAAGLQHPGIVVVHDFGEHDQVPYLVMELLAGGTLQEELRTGPGPVGWVAEVGARIADALVVAHQAGIVHRDIKPSNLFLTADGTVKILDFGLVRAGSAGAGGGSESTRAVGTPGYLAPEQLYGTSVDARADLYGLGATLYALLTGHSPYHGMPFSVLVHALVHRDPDPLQPLRPDLPAEFEELVLKLLARLPDERPASAAEVADQLHGLAERLTGTAPPRGVAALAAVRVPATARPARVWVRSASAAKRRQWRPVTRVAAVVLGVTVLAGLGTTAADLWPSGSSGDLLPLPGNPTPPPSAPPAPARLAVGDCVDYTTAPAKAEVPLEDHLGWTKVGCDQPHQAQVRLVGELADASHISWRSAAAVGDIPCGSSVGLFQLHAPAPIGSVVLGPTEEDWFAHHDRYTYCTVHRMDGQPLDFDARPAPSSSS